MKFNPAKSSLSRRFNIYIIGVVILIAFLFLVVITIVGTRNIEREMENRLTRIATIAESSLPPVIWNFDREAIKSICESLFKEKGVVFLRLENVNDSNQPLFDRQEELYYGKAFVFFKNSDQFQTKQSPIYYKGERVASFQLVFSKELLKEELRNNILNLVLLIVVILGAIYWIVVFISKRNIFIPLKTLELSAEKISKGELNTHISVTGEDEIGSLARAFIRMQFAVKNSIESEQKANKAKDKFLAKISHEARTPLNNIFGFIELVLNSELQKEQRENLTLAASSTQDLLRIINDILDFSKMESGEFEIIHTNFNFQTILESINRTTNLKAKEKNLEFEIKLDENIYGLQLKGDGGRLKEILINLIKNSINHTEKGSVCLNVELKEKNCDIVSILFSVTDTGSGIPPEYLNKIFEPYQQIPREQSNNTERGIGLGLTISKQLVNKMGGEIQVVSEWGKGTTFLFTLPFELSEITDNQATVDSKIQLETDWTILNGLHILLAEDDPVTQILMKKILSQNGIFVDLAKTGREAVKMVFENEYDILLMDMGLPELSGSEAMKIIRNESRFINLPIIAVTADAIVGHEKEYRDAGASDYLKKPINRNLILEKIFEWKNKSKIKVLDIEEALTRLKIDREFYFFTLNIMLKNVDALIEELKKIISSGIFDKAGDLLHNLYGSAINFSANELGITVEKLYLILKNDPINQDILLQLIQNIENAYFRLINYVKVEIKAISTNSQSSLDNISINKTNIEFHLSNLSQLIKNSNYESLYEMNKLLPELSSHIPNEILEEFKNNVYLFNFDEAYEQLNAIISKYGFLFSKNQEKEL